MPADDSLIAQGTVDARDEGRRAYNAGPKIDRWTVTCSKCGKQFHAAQQYHDHRAPGYPCGPVAR